TPGGTAWKTVSDLLGNRQYEPEATAQLQLPSNIDGGAFYSAEDEDHIYVLWAKTNGASETAQAAYSFPASLNINAATQFDWQNKQSSVSNTVRLTGSPVFIVRN